MTDKTAAEEAVWENPLMPNARLRQIYLAMIRSRARAVPAARGECSTLGLEACLVSPTIGLGAGDLVSDVLSGPAIDFLRRVPIAGKKHPAHMADCGDARRLPGAAGSAERIWTAVGAAAALQSLGAQQGSSSSVKAELGVVVLYLMPGEIPTPLLQKIFTFAHNGKLPLVFLLLPSASGGCTGSAARKTARLSSLALRCGVPAIPTDATDAVAIYRAAQESILHARIGAGPAVLECLSVPTGSKLKSKPDAITGMEEYMLPRKVVTRAWLDRAAKSFSQKLARESKSLR